MTPRGYAALKAELLRLLDEERPVLVRTVAWAASNGDRSENGDYIYGKKRLREIDRRIHYLTRQLDTAEVIASDARVNEERVFFGATVAYRDETGAARCITITGRDEADPGHGKVSWRSPIARAFMRRRAGDIVLLSTPGGEEELEILDVHYELAT